MLKIKEIREAKNLTQDEIVGITGIKKRSYVDYENGKSDIPLSKLQKIAIALNVEIAELIEGSLKKTKNAKNVIVSNDNINDNENDTKRNVKKTLSFKEAVPNPPDNTSNEIIHLLKENKSLVEEKNKLLESENKRLNNEVSNLSNQNKALAAENKELAAQNANLQSKNKELAIQLNYTKQENNALKKGLQNRAAG
ncbi:MAG: hypothetical protein CSB01_00695 [Bacteroidia bacterium]|nr:MAG: hypothetical protein CSB01_00695 [Bacteroidia bacterium]